MVNSKICLDQLKCNLNLEIDALVCHLIDTKCCKYFCSSMLWVHILTCCGACFFVNIYIYIFLYFLYFSELLSIIICMLLWWAVIHYIISVNCYLLCYFSALLCKYFVMSVSCYLSLFYFKEQLSRVLSFHWAVICCCMYFSELLSVMLFQWAVIEWLKAPPGGQCVEQKQCWQVSTSLTYSLVPEFRK